MSTVNKWGLMITVIVLWVAVVRTVFIGAPDNSIGLLDVMPGAIVFVGIEQEDGERRPR